LNFLARDDPDARRGGCPLTETDTFTTRVGPRNEFVQTGWIKTFSSRLLLPHRRQRRRGQPDPPTPFGTSFTGCKAQTSSMAYSNKMIKEDHLLACTTRMSEFSSSRRSPTGANSHGRPTTWIRPGRLSTTRRSGHTPSRLPTIHLSKSSTFLRRPARESSHAARRSCPLNAPFGPSGEAES